MSRSPALRTVALLLTLSVMHAPALLAQQQPRQPISASQLRDLQTSLQATGLSLEQIRSRLRAQGFSESVLDSYYAGTGNALPDSNVFAAVRALGLSISKDTTTPGAKDTRLLATSDSVMRARAFLDSVDALAKDEPTREAMLALLRNRESRRALLDSGLTVFGASVFERDNTLFSPDDAGPVPPGYRIGPGDELVLILTGDTERLHQLAVTREGMVFIPDVGAVAVANLTMQQLEEVLWTRLGRVYSGIRRGANATAQFQITVSKLGSTQVSVLGNVNTPGAYRISKLGTVLTALYAAGGPSEGGSMRRIEVRRAGKTTVTLDMYDYLISGNSSKDARLESGDIILVPPRGPQTRITGAVIRPATYELAPGQSLGDLIRMAGGFRAEADRRRVQIRRVVPPEQRSAAGTDRVLFDVGGPTLESSTEPLTAGDVVVVSTIASRVANQVTIEGNVWSPGDVALVPGMRLFDALARTGGIQPDTYLDALHVSRLQPDSTRRMLRVRVPTQRGSEDDVALMPDDQIRVFAMSEYRPARTVTIGGAVRQPGQFLFRDGMTIRDLLMLAGGVEEGALLSEAEVARMPSERADGTTAITTRVALDSTYLFDRLPGAPYLGPPGLPGAAGGAPDYQLKAYDNVLILRQPDWYMPRVVRLRGEVRYPGNYALKSKGDRLVDLIQRAGGLTKDAYPEGIVFIRTQPNVGRVGIDLPAAMRRQSHPDNMLLLDGDSIHVPFYSPVVTVKGSVNSAVAVPFVRGRGIDYYVYAAGGPTARGEMKKSYVTQPSGKVESSQRFLYFFRSRPTPQPGSSVSVPERPESMKFDFVSAIAATTSILTSIVALSALIHGKI